MSKNIEDEMETGFVEVISYSPKPQTLNHKLQRSHILWVIVRVQGGAGLRLTNVRVLTSGERGFGFRVAQGRSCDVRAWGVV